jgi:hypothetical protein
MRPGKDFAGLIFKLSRLLFQKSAGLFAGLGGIKKTHRQPGDSANDKTNEETRATFSFRHLLFLLFSAEKSIEQADGLTATLNERGNLC